MALVALAKGENLPFESLCNCFEELCKPTNDRHHRERLVRKLWENFAIKEQPSFPLFRLMLPHLDTSSRPNYKLKQKGLANLYVDIMGLEKNSMEARTIVDWKRPSTGLQRSEQGNFPEVMYSVLKERCKPRADLRRVTVGEVNTMLDRLACESEKRAPMRDIHIRCTALEQKWLLRVITKDLAIGFKEDKIFKMLHPDAQELYNSVCDLKQTCDRCADPEYRLESISLELFTPVSPPPTPPAPLTPLPPPTHPHPPTQSPPPSLSPRATHHQRKEARPWRTRSVRLPPAGPVATGCAR